MIPAGFGVVHSLKNKSRMSQLHFYFVYRMQKMQKLLRWIIFIQFLLVSCVVFAQENTATSTSEASSSHLSAIYGWKLVSSVNDLSGDFFFNLQEGQPVSGDYFFALVSHHKGLENPSYLGGKVEANAPIMENTKFTSTEYLRLRFIGGTDIVISDGNSEMYWVVDAPERTITYGPLESAARFKIFVNEKNPTIVFLKTGNLFVRTFGGSIGKISLSPFLIDRSFFYARTTSNTNSTQLRTDLDILILQNRIQVLTTNGSVLLTSCWIAYELALSNLLGIDLNQFTIAKVKGIDLALLFDKTFELMTNDLYLKKEYLYYYPTFGKFLVNDFQLYTLMKNFQVEKRFLQDLPWLSFRHLLFQVTTFPSKSDTQKLFQKMILIDAIFQDQEYKTQLFGPIKEEELDPLFLDFFQSSCFLAELEFGGKELINLVQKIDNTLFPRFRQKEQFVLRQKIIKNENTIEKYWFSSLLVPESKISLTKMDQNTIPNLPKELFYELALLKHLTPQWISSHSTIGENIAQFFINFFQETNFEIEKFKKRSTHFATNLQVNEILTVAEQYCTDESQFSFCILPQISFVLENFDFFLQKTQNSESVMDLREVMDLNGQEYNRLMKQETQTNQLFEDLSKAQEEMTLFTSQMGNDLLQKIDDTTLSFLIDLSNQIEKNSKAFHERLVENVGFIMGIQKSLSDRKLQIAFSKFEKANAVKDEYLETLKLLVKVAFSETITEMVFGVVSTIVSFGDLGQSILSPKDHPNPNGLLTISDKAFNLGITASKLSNTIALNKQLNELIPGLLNMAQSIEAQVPKIQALREAALPLVNSSGQVNETMLAKQTIAFNSVFDDIIRLNMSLVLRQGDQIFDLLAGHLCTYINRVSYPPCVKVHGLNTEYFNNLREGMDALNDVLSMLGGLSSYATDILSAQTFQSFLNAGFYVTNSEIAAFKQEWGNDDKKRESWIFSYRKQVNLGKSINTFFGLQGSLNHLMNLYTLCNSLAYSNGGVPPKECTEQVYKYKRVDPITLNALLAFQGSTKPYVEQINAMIPTFPQFANDTGYIELPNLMNGYPVTFQLSRNAEILQKLGWITSESDLEDSVIFLKKFTLILPPRFSDSQEEVAIEIETQGITDLGPGLEKRRLKRYFEAPPTQFKVEYGNTGWCPEESLLESPYATCSSKILPVCIQSPGDTNVIERGLNVGLFSEFKLTAKFNSPSNSPRFAYNLMATPMFLQVKAEILVNPLNDRRRNLRQQTSDVPSQKRRRTAEVSKTCCPPKHYAYDWSQEGTCKPCPEGSIPQLGGLFCVSYPTLTNGNSSVPTAVG